MKRRNFIQSGSMVAAATAMLPNSLFATPPKEKKKPFVVIIGSGIAGLGAARKLKEAEYDFIILESRKRPGGRIFTYKMDSASEYTLELGAEWIGDSHKELRAWNNSQQIEELNHQFDTRLILNEKFYEKDEWRFDETQNLLEVAKNKFRTTAENKLKSLDKLDYWRYLEKLGTSEKNMELRELFDSTDFGESIRNVSAYGALSEYAESSQKNEMDFIAKGGNTEMIHSLIKFVGEERIKYSHIVDMVKIRGNKTVITCTNGFMIECDRVICTIPTYAITKIKWDPVLPTSKRDAIDQLQYCRIIKTSILFSERFWKDESFDMMTDSLGHYFFHSTKGQIGKKGILTSYAVGDKAYVLSKMDKTKKMNVLADCIRPAFGNIGNFAEDLVSYYWGSDIHTQGAYAIYDTNQWFTQRKEIAERFKTVYFAGEHIAEWQGFMEGAFVTGMDAAKSIIEG